MSNSGGSNKPTKNIIIGCSGSVATIKLPLLIKLLLDSESPYKFVIKIVVTDRAKHFFDSKDIPLGIQIFNDEDEWKMWKKRGDPVLHIDLGKWADLFVIAPLDANSMAKLSTVSISLNIVLYTYYHYITSLHFTIQLVFSYHLLPSCLLFHWWMNG